MAMEIEMYDLTNREHVNGEEQCAEHGGLRNTLFDTLKTKFSVTSARGGAEICWKDMIETMKGEGE